ncbi:MAG: hypothetical protein K6D91_09815 [Prevotella sp.]|nr:hypothetical protein [Prevotella sp.]
MRINQMTFVALMVLVLIVLNVLFFVWTDVETRGIVEWMSYGFAMFSFVVASIAVLRVSKDSDEVYHLTTTFLPLSYFCVQTVLSAVAIGYGMVLRRTQETAQSLTSNMQDTVNKVVESLPDSVAGIATDSIGSAIGNTVNTTTETVVGRSMFLAENYTVIVLSVYLLVLLFYAFNLGIHKTANDATRESLAEQAAEQDSKMQLSQRLQLLEVKVKDAAAKKEVNRLYETIRYGANHTTPQGKQIEGAITAGLDELSALIDRADWEKVRELAQELTVRAKMR